MAAHPAHATALLDWLACAAGGWDEPAARAARAGADGLLGRTVALGAAGHALDFDDTYLPGVAHLSAGVAPAALALASAQDRTTGEVLDAFAAGFEAMAALTRASHPALYERGWHPTAVGASVGAAAAGAVLLGLDEERAGVAAALASLRAAGPRAGFGSDGKALGVGLAAADGLACARLAAAGARMPTGAVRGPGSFEAVTGGTWAAPDPAAPPAVRENWLKPWPCCLFAHAPIEAAERVRAAHGGPPPGAIVVRVHPRARQAAPYDTAADGLQARFAIGLLVARTLLDGPPDVAALTRADARAAAFAAERVTVTCDEALGEAGARIEDAGGAVLADVAASLGSPERPMTADALAAKARGLAGTRLDGALEDPGRPAREVLAALGPA
jgi:2-methylcitrate dehydratase PrpD